MTTIQYVKDKYSKAVLCADVDQLNEYKNKRRVLKNIHSMHEQKITSIQQELMSTQKELCEIKRLLNMLLENRDKT